MPDVNLGPPLLSQTHMCTHTNMPTQTHTYNERWEANLSYMMKPFLQSDLLALFSSFFTISHLFLPLLVFRDHDHTSFPKFNQILHFPAFQLGKCSDLELYFEGVQIPLTSFLCFFFPVYPLGGFLDTSGAQTSFALDSIFFSPSHAPLVVLHLWLVSPTHTDVYLQP